MVIKKQEDEEMKRERDWKRKTKEITGWSRAKAKKSGRPNCNGDWSKTIGSHSNHRRPSSSNEHEHHTNKEEEGSKLD